MIRNVILHLHNELPLKADIESLPTAADAGLLCTNLRTLEGRKPLTTEYLDSVFLIPYNIIRFIEIPRASIDQAGLGMDLPIRPVQLPAEASGVSRATPASSSRHRRVASGQPVRVRRRRPWNTWSRTRSCSGASARLSARNRRHGWCADAPVLHSPAMTKNLVIVESPAKARTIERYLGDGYKVLASYGHVRDLPENPGKGKLGVDVEHDFAPEYVVSEDRRKQLEAIGRAAASSDLVYLATDLDREGEAIAWHIVEAVEIPGDKTPPRHLQRDHQGRHRRGLRPSARHRHGPRRRAADAAHHGPPRGLHAQPAHLAQGAQRPLRGARAVGGRAPRRGARARRSRPSRPASTGRWRPACGPRATSPSRPAWSASTGPRSHAAARSVAARCPSPTRPPPARTWRSCAASRPWSRRAPCAPASATPRRRSPPAPCSRRPAASSASAPSARCPWPSGSTRASTSTASRPASSPTCGPTR